MRVREAAIAVLFLFLAQTYLAESNYYVRKQMTELALAAILGLFVAKLVTDRPCTQSSSP